MKRVLRPKTKPPFHSPQPTPQPKWLSSSTAQPPFQNPFHHHLHAIFSSTRNNPKEQELSLVTLLKLCSTQDLLPQAEQLHSFAIKSALDSNIFISNSLLSFYSKCGLLSHAQKIFGSGKRLDLVSCNIMLSGYVRSGQLNEACHLFDRMPTKNCVAYTTLIMGLTQHGLWSNAIQVFESMRSFDVLPNEVTMATIISAYSHITHNKFILNGGRMLHGLVVKIGLEAFVFVSTNLLHFYCVNAQLVEGERVFNEMEEKNVVSWNVMLNGYAKAGLVDLAWQLFEKIGDKDVVSWGTVIDCYVQRGRLSEAVSLYCEMVRTGLCPNDVMIVDIVSACAQAEASIEGRQFHGVGVKMGFDCYDFVQSTIIHFYAACREIDLAYLQFEVGSKDHVASWNALMSGLIRNGMIDEAKHLFNKMPEKDVFSWSTMISGYSQTDQPNLALELFQGMVANGVKPNEVTMVSVLSAIANLGRLQEARWAHEYILFSRIPLNDNLSAAVIDMYAKCGSIHAALDVFYQIREKATDVSPWNAIICGLAMHGHAQLSLRIFSDLQRCNIKPNSITFIGVLSACCHAGLVEAGEQHFEDMKSMYQLEPNIKHYGCMVDLLGRAGRLGEAEKLIKSMPMEADVVIWGTLLAACKTHNDTIIGERAAEHLARVEPSHGPSRVLLSNIYADAGRWDDAFLVRWAMQKQKLMRSPGYSGVA